MNDNHPNADYIERVTNDRLDSKPTLLDIIMFGSAILALGSVGLGMVWLALHGIVMSWNGLVMTWTGGMT